MVFVNIYMEWNLLLWFQQLFCLLKDFVCINYMYCREFQCCHLWKPATYSKFWARPWTLNGSPFFDSLSYSPLIMAPQYYFRFLPKTTQPRQWLITKWTRQSSCMTARGVPPTSPPPKVSIIFVHFFVQHFCPNLFGVLPGVPPSRGVPLGWCPLQFGGYPWSPPSWGDSRGTPPPCEQTNWKHYLPVIHRMRAVIKYN